MTLIISTIIYLLGVLASVITMAYIDAKICKNKETSLSVLCILSWLALFAMIMYYLIEINPIGIFYNWLYNKFEKNSNNNNN